MVGSIRPRTREAAGGRRRPLAISTIIACVLVAQELYIPAYATRFHAKPVEWIVSALWILAFASEEMRSPHTRVRDALLARRWELGALMAFVLVVYTNAVMGRGFGSYLYTRIVPEFVFFYILGAAHSARNDGSFGVLLYLGLICLGISAFFSVPILASRPRFVRYLAMHDALQIEYYRYGIAPHAQYKNWTLMLPVLGALAWDQVMWKRVVGLVFVAAVMYVLLISSFKAVLLLLAVGTLLFGGLTALLISLRGGRRRVGTSIATLIVVTGIAVAVWGSASALGFSRTADATTGLVERVGDRGLEYGDTSGRGWRSRASLRTIQEHPLFGVGAMLCTVEGFQYVSNHMQWLDSIAEYGLVGTAPLFAFLVLMLLRFWRGSAETDQSERLRAALLSTAILFVVAGLINPLLVYWSTAFVFVFLGGDVARKPVAAETGPGAVRLRRRGLSGRAVRPVTGGRPVGGAMGGPGGIA